MSESARDSGKSPSTLVLDGFSLHIVRGAQRSKKRDFLLRTPLCRIGKAPTVNDVVLDDDTVSRQHCEIARDGRGYLLRDLESTNGTLLDGAEIREAYLRAGSLLTVGNVQLRFNPIEDRIEISPSERSALGGMVGSSTAMREVYALVEHIAQTDAPVLIDGPPGTGKRLCARTLHDLGPRAHAPYVEVDCRASSSPTELGAILYGEERARGSAGAIERAQRGTLVLVEVCDLPTAQQEALARLVERREWRRTGTGPARRLEARVIATSSRSLEEEVERGHFIAPLERSLRSLRCAMPPLAARGDDWVLLLRHFAHRLAPGQLLDEERLRALPMPPLLGNVADLQRLVPFVVRPSGATAVGTFDARESYRQQKARFEADFERRYVSWLLQANEGNISRAARAADMDRKYLHKLLKKYAVDL